MAGHASSCDCVAAENRFANQFATAGWKRLGFMDSGIITSLAANCTDETSALPRNGRRLRLCLFAPLRERILPDAEASALHSRTLQVLAPTQAPQQPRLVSSEQEPVRGSRSRSFF